jgi:hypothetical protein
MHDWSPVFIGFISYLNNDVIQLLVLYALHMPSFLSIYRASWYIYAKHCFSELFRKCNDLICRNVRVIAVHGYIPFVVIIIMSFPHAWLITCFHWGSCCSIFDILCNSLSTIFCCLFKIKSLYCPTPRDALTEHEQLCWVQACKSSPVPSLNCYMYVCTFFYYDVFH